MAFPRQPLALMAAGSLVGLACIAGSPAASAADLGTNLIDCGGDGSPLPVDISGSVGDTFALHDDDDSSKDCTDVAASPSGIVTWSETPGGTDEPTTLPGTGGSSGSGGTFYFTLLAPGTTTVSYETDGGTESFTVTVAAVPSASGGSGPTMQLQQLPIPSSGNCADADPNDALWAKSNSTPWTLQWGEWTEPVRFSGLVCGRWVWADGTP